MSSTRLNVADAGLAGDAASASGKARSASGGSGRLLGGVAGAAKAVGSGATTGVMAGLKGVVSVGKGVGKGAMSSGRGFRDFLLRGQVVELAVAVVVGMAFTDLVNAVVKSFITPLIAAIFRGVSFTDLYFTINSSQFLYGQAINAFIVFILVLAFTYYGIMRPIQNFTSLFYPQRAENKDCPLCLSEIPLGATRCKNCGADMEITEEQQALLDKMAAERMFSGKGMCGCAPCFAAGRAAKGVVAGAGGRGKCGADSAIDDAERGEAGGSGSGGASGRGYNGGSAGEAKPAAWPAPGAAAGGAQADGQPVVLVVTGADTRAPQLQQPLPTAAASQQARAVVGLAAIGAAPVALAAAGSADGSRALGGAAAPVLRGGSVSGGGSFTSIDDGSFVSFEDRDDPPTAANPQRSGAAAPPGTR